MNWEERLLRLLFVSYALFLAGFFYIPNAVDLYKFYSVAVLAPGLFLLPRGFRLLRGNILFLLIIVYLGYMLVSPVWGGHFEWPAYLNYLRLALFVIVFVVSTVLLYKQWPQTFTAMLRLMSLLVAVAAFASIIIWYRDPAAQPRLIGIGILENPNASSYVYAVFAVLNLAYAFNKKSSAWLRALHMASVIILFAFVLFTYSRGSLLALAAASMIMMIGWRPGKVMIAALLLGSLVFAVYFYFPQTVALLDRKVGARLDIWQAVLSKIFEAPVWGHGFLTDQYVKVDGILLFSHNAYLAAFRDGGMVGGLLLLAMLGMAVYQAWQAGRDSGDYHYLALLILALVCMSFDTDRLLTRPRELWLVLWLPMALVLGYHVARKRGATHLVSQ